MINQKNNDDPVSLQNKMVVIAGGSNKTGRAIAEKLAQTGASVVIADVHLINAEIVVQHLIEKYKTAAAAVGPNLDEIRSTITALSGKKETAIWVNAGLLNKNSHDVFALSDEVARYMKISKEESMIIHLIPVPVDENIPELITRSLMNQNNIYGSNFCVSYSINCLRVSAYGRVHGAEFWQKVLALVLDILSVTIP